jgi:putative pyoverdin transport system ATP-binding/permease protein
MNLIWFLLKDSWTVVTIAGLTGSLSGLCSILLIALINRAATSNQPINGALPAETLLGAFIGLAFISLLTGILSQFLLVKLAQSAVYKMRLRLSGWILACPLRHLEELGANRLLATLTDDVAAISNTVFVLPFLCVDIALILGGFAYLGWLSGIMFLGTMVFIAVAIALIQFLLTKARRVLKLARDEQDHLFRHFNTLANGIKELKLHTQRREMFLNDELHATAALSRDYNVRALGIAAIAQNIGQLLFFLIVGLLVFGLPRLMAVSTSVLSGYILTITYLLRPLGSLLQVLPALNQASVSLQKIETLGLSLASHAERNESSQSSIAQSATCIEMCQITHSYRRENEDSSFTFGPIDLKFQLGELVFIVGGNGSGKSTLVKLIAGLYLAETGKILVNGEPVSQHNLEWYRQQFSVVFADFHLFERFLGLDQPDLETQVRDYLVKFELDQKVQIQNGALSTTALSQGQRKRLALLTAYLEDRPFYIFDEWASDQDPVFKQIFYTLLLPELKQRGKTILAISHDDHYFHLADRTIKLDYGQLEYDSHPCSQTDSYIA